MNRGVTGKQNTRNKMQCDGECTDKWVTDDEDDTDEEEDCATLSKTFLLSILLSHCGTSK